MARIPDSTSLTKPSLDALRGDPKSVSRAATGDAFGAGVAQAAGQAGQVLFREAKQQREKAFAENRAAALNELGATLPHEFDAAIAEARENMQAGGRGFSQTVGARLNEIFDRRLGETLNKRSLRESDVNDIRARVQPLMTRARLQATEFERQEGRKQFLADTEKQLEFLRLQAAKDPAKLPAVTQQIQGILSNSREHLTPSQAQELKQKALRRLHVSVVETQIQRSPGTVLANLKSGKLDALVKEGVLTAKDVTIIRKSAERGVKRQAVLAEAARRQQFAKFRSDLEIATRRGEVGQKTIDQAFKDGKINLRERTQLVLIADKRREAKERFEAKREEALARLERKQTLTTAQQGLRASLDELMRAGVADPTMIQFAFSMGAISRRGMQQRLKLLEDREKAIAAREARVERVRQAERVPLDPKSAADRKAVEETFRRDVVPKIKERGKKPFGQIIAEFVAPTGILPDSVKSMVRRGLGSGNAKLVADAADLYDRIVSRNPKLSQQFDEKDRIYAAHIMTSMRSGVGPAKAVELANIAIHKKTEPQIKERQRFLSANGKSIREGNLELLTNEFGTVGGVQTIVLGRLGQTTVTIGADIQADFNNLVERFYLESENLEASRTAALAAIKSQYGVTKIGPARMMKRPPEVEYAVPGVDPKWIKEELIRDVRKNAVLDKSVSENLGDSLIIALPLGQQRAAQPRYHVFIKGPNGALFPVASPKTGRPILWAPDWNKSAERKRLEDRRKKELSEAIEGGRRDRQRRIENQRLNRAFGRQIKRAQEKAR